jgi:hypothetical protein
MNVVKFELRGSKWVETCIARNLTPKVAKVRAKSLNDKRDTGSETCDEQSLVSYVAR